MSYHAGQFRDLIRRVLQQHELWSEAAENLLLGTAAAESAFGRFLRQLGGGPAIGAFQMEPNTFNWLRDKYGLTYGFFDLPAERMETDLALAILLCRLRYYAVPAPLPPADEPQALADYWKEHYNTYLGSGTASGFIAAAERYLA